MVVTICLDTLSMGEWMGGDGGGEDASLSLKNVMMGGVNKGRLFVLLAGGLGDLWEEFQVILNRASMFVPSIVLRSRLFL